MGIFSWIILGLIAGALAKWIMPGPDPGGWIVTIIIGIVGAFIGGFIAKLLGLTAYNVIGEVVVATAGAIICLFVWQRIRGK